MPQVNRVERLIISHDTAMPLLCAWADCERRARTPYQIIVCEHQPVRCDLVNDPPPGYYLGRHYHYAFCSESCLDYWRASSGRRAADTGDRHRGVIWGNHSPGMAARR